MNSGSTIAMCRSTSAAPGRGRASARMPRWVDRALTPAGLNVTEHVTVAAQEEDAVTGGIRSVPIEFVVRDFDFRSVVDVSPPERFIRPVVRDAHVGLAVPDVDFIGPVGVCFTAA